MTKVMVYDNNQSGAIFLQPYGELFIHHYSLPPVVLKFYY
jgi:hypothetical protein